MSQVMNDFMHTLMIINTGEISREKGIMLIQLLVRDGPGV